MSSTTQARLRALTVLVTPLVVLAAFLWHPYVADVTDPDETAAEILAGPTRWLWSHILIVVALGLTALLIFAIRTYIREKGEERWSFTAVPLITLGAALVAGLAGMEGLGGWAVAESGASASDLVAFFDDAQTEANVLFTVGGVLFSLGFLALAMSVYKSGAFSQGTATVVVVAIIVQVIASFIPLGWAGYVIGGAAVVAGYLIGSQMWREAGVPAPSMPQMGHEMA